MNKKIDPIEQGKLDWIAERAKPNRGEFSLHDIQIDFGKHQGMRLVHVPVGYLRYIVSREINRTEPISGEPWKIIAQRELDRRGYVGHPVNLSGHAIDDFSRRGLNIWLKPFQKRQTNLGMVSFLQDLFWTDVQNEAMKWQKTSGESYHLYGSHGIRWTFTVRDTRDGTKDYDVVSLYCDRANS